MKIKYNGPKNVKRVIGDLVWSLDNNHTVDVSDPQMVKTLMAQPNGEFTQAEQSAEVKSNMGKRGKA